MSPTVPISRFVDEETLEPTLTPKPTVEALDGATDQKAITPPEAHVHLDARFEYRSSPPLDADGLDADGVEPIADAPVLIEDRRYLSTEPELMASRGHQNAPQRMQRQHR
jgi:hypothetical protein